MEKGAKNRHVGATNMNSESSRSHSVLSTTIECSIKSNFSGVTSTRTSTFNIIDLAGSERTKDTHAQGERLKEAGQINKSLSALGNVIKALSSDKDMGHIPYRSSKLTFILKNSLGGNSKTLIIANISPSSLHKNETISTLEFAKRAKLMKNKAMVNSDSIGNVHCLKKEISSLKQQIE
jgi:kinesin family protein 15